MKRTLLAVLIFPSAALAAPFVVSDPLAPVATHCGVFLDTGAKVVIPVTVEGSGKICKFDLAGISNGSHVVKMTGIVNDPLWPAEESAQSAPLSFARPAAPAIPAGLRLVP
jgi:hypothetical protein